MIAVVAAVVAVEVIAVVLVVDKVGVFVTECIRISFLIRVPIKISRPEFVCARAVV